MLDHISTDNYGIRYRMRTRAKAPLWRTHIYDQSTGEPFYYQHVLLYYPIENQQHLDELKDMTESDTWRELFFFICYDNACLIDPELRDQIIAVDTAFSEQDQTNVPVECMTFDDRVEDATLELSSQLRVLSQEQQVAFDTIMDSPSMQGPILIYGAAGTGKSYLLKTLYNGFICSGVMPIVLAPTGVSAFTINGQTLNRFFGIDIDDGDVNLIRLQDFIKIHQNVVFLVDECSMISNTTILRISDGLRRITGNPIAFGGCMVIFFGDHGQLPPVSVTDEGYFFYSPVLADATMVTLFQSQRQNQDDAEFLQFLNLLRTNNIENTFVHQYVRDRHVQQNTIPDNYLRLYTTSDLVQQYNEERVQAINALPKAYFSTDMGPDVVLRKTHLLRVLNLKLNAFCMLIHNVDVAGGWVNGTRCTVHNIDSERFVFVRRVSDGAIRSLQPITRDIYRTGYSRTQLPLTLSYASTIHKVQSLTLEDGAAVCLTRPFQSFGQLYVACSRVRSGNRLSFFGPTSRLVVTTDANIEGYLDVVEAQRSQE